MAKLTAPAFYHEPVCRSTWSVTAQIFLLSPAHCGGRRAGMLLRRDSDLPVAERCRAGTLTLGEAFSFVSGLYFRGKLAYACAFGRPHAAVESAAFVITPTRGLQAPAMPVTTDLVREFASVDVSPENRRYRLPLERDVEALAAHLPPDARVVFLGSLATDKYVDPLADILGSRLHYPPAFVGRGDMSRGGLLLRSVTDRTELEYAVFHAGALRRGRRPPKLEPIARTRRAH
jgi:hypothetical protein